MKKSNVQIAKEAWNELDWLERVDFFESIADDHDVDGQTAGLEGEMDESRYHLRMSSLYNKLVKEIRKRN